MHTHASENLSPDPEHSYAIVIERLRALLDDDTKQEIDNLFLKAQLDPKAAKKTYDDWVEEAESAVERIQDPDGSESDMRNGIIALFVAHRMANNSYVQENPLLDNNN